MTDRIHNKLKPVYNTYSGHVYSLCLRLLADERSASAATVEVFVRFSKEPDPAWEEPLLFSRLKELAIVASVRRFKRGRKVKWIRY